MTSAGIWAHPADRHLTIVLLRPDGTRQPPVHVARTKAARASLVHYLGGYANHLTVTESVARQDRLVEHLHSSPLTVWLVPDPLLKALAQAAGLGDSAARSRAAILARLPGVSAFKPLLRRIQPPDPRQLTLLR